MEDLMKWRKDHTGVHSAQAVGRRRAYLKGLSRQAVRDIERALLPQAQQGREYLVAENARPYQGRLGLITEVRLATSLKGLLTLVDVSGDDPRLVRQRLEALMTFDACVGMHEVERHASFAQTKHALDDVIRRFSKTFFNGSEERTVWSSHNARDHYHVTGVSDAGRPPRVRHVIRHTLFCRRMRLAGAWAPVVFDYRLKSRFDTLLKMQKQYDDPNRRSHAFDVHDRCGLRLVVPEDAHVAHALRAVLAFLEEPDLGAVVIERPDDPRPAARGARNKHSSERFRVCKITAAVGGQCFEIQIQTLADWLSGRTATDGVNHDVYRLTQCLDVYFPLLFPPRVYGVNWRAKAIRTELMTWKRRSLGLLADVRIRRHQ